MLGTPLSEVFAPYPACSWHTYTRADDNVLKRQLLPKDCMQTSDADSSARSNCATLGTRNNSTGHPAMFPTWAKHKTQNTLFSTRLKDNEAFVLTPQISSLHSIVCLRTHRDKLTAPGRGVLHRNCRLQAPLLWSRCLPRL